MRSIEAVFRKKLTPPCWIVLWRRPLWQTPRRVGTFLPAPKAKMSIESALQPRDHAERVAAFRYSLIGALVTRQDMSHGVLAESLRAIAAQTHRPPDATRTRRFSVATLERWLYAYKKGGFEALRPDPRSDAGRGRQLSPELRELLLDIRREFPSASVPLILKTLQIDGRLDPETLSEATLRRLYRQEGLVHVAEKAAENEQKTRLRWQTSHPDALWHSDVCHGPTLTDGDRRIPTRIHAILDDHSRYIVALHVVSTERENDMLHLLVEALRLQGKPDALYLDNGSTYRGDALQMLCARLGISLLHARPYDPQARGKMERFWLTMRRQALDFCEQVGSLHDMQVRLYGWLDQHYHTTHHAALMGKTPKAVYLPENRQIVAVDEAALGAALTLTETRKVRRDTTVSIDGCCYELDRGWLAGRQVDIHYSALDEPIAPWAEYEGKRYDLHPVDAEANAHKKRPPRLDPTAKKPAKKPDFNPPKALLDKALGRCNPKEQP